jgi:hypothetical protein
LSYDVCYSYSAHGGDELFIKNFDGKPERDHSEQLGVNGTTLELINELV